MELDEARKEATVSDFGLYKCITHFQWKLDDLRTSRIINDASE